MSDLISRQAAIDAVGYYSLHSGDKLLFADAPLKALPSADTVEHGRWEWIGGYGYQYRCSECIICAERQTKYCPHCGALMDEVSE